MDKLTIKMESYLETIAEICEREGSARVTDIALKLNVTKATVNRAVSVLCGMGLTAAERYRDVTMTEEGKQYAKRIFGKHDVLERFFIKVLKIDPVVAQRDACSAEHVLSEETLRAMRRYMKAHANEA